MRSESIELGAPLGITWAPSTSAACACRTLAVSVVTGLRPPSQTTRLGTAIAAIRRPAAMARMRRIAWKSRRRSSGAATGAPVQPVDHDLRAGALVGQRVVVEREVEGERDALGVLAVGAHAVDH